MHKIWPGRRAHWVEYEIINNSDLDGMPLASFCQSRAAMPMHKKGLCEEMMRTDIDSNIFPTT